jgi:hypothetical protein
LSQALHQVGTVQQLGCRPGWGIKRCTDDLVQRRLNSPSHENADTGAGAGHENGSGGGEGAGEMGMDLGSGMGGAPPSFYVAPQPAHLVQGGPGPFAQMPLPLPPPPLTSVRVSALRHLFTDIPTAGAAHGRGTLVDPARKAVWSGRGDDEVGMGVGRGKGTLERRLVDRVVREALAARLPRSTSPRSRRTSCRAGPVRSRRCRSRSRRRPSRACVYRRCGTSSQISPQQVLRAGGARWSTLRARPCGAGAGTTRWGWASAGERARSSGGWWFA